MSYVVRPLEPWIGTATLYRRTAGFKASWTDTLTLLEREIFRLGHDRARPWVLQIDVPDRMINRDGSLSARATPESPAVRVCVETARQGPLTFPSDGYHRWQANVRAVALTLEALRAVDRWGVSRTGEQYRGWTAIAARPAEMTREQAAEFIAHWAGLYQPAHEIATNPATLATAYRIAARRAHPDVTGDDGDTMARLNAARDLLRSP